ncbi:MAG: hypothetical protein LBR10_09910 [Prevotellaceae bacterium]|nr:hypothetical protein [Prevotellaceae bacterium]
MKQQCIQKPPNEAPGASPNRIKTILGFTLLILSMSCSNNVDQQIGTIIFSSDSPCTFKLFDSQGRQIASDKCDSIQNQAVIAMKSTGLFVLLADNGTKEIKTPVVYPGGNISFYIEFN